MLAELDVFEANKSNELLLDLLTALVRNDDREKGGVAVDRAEKAHSTILGLLEESVHKELKLVNLARIDHCEIFWLHLGRFLLRLNLLRLFKLGLLLCKCRRFRRLMGAHDAIKLVTPATIISLASFRFLLLAITRFG